MQNAETVLGVLRERGRRGLPCDELYRQLFNKDLYLLAYGRIYANQGAMTPGVTPETVDGMSMAKIEAVIERVRHERYRFCPVKRIYIPKKNGRMRPLGLPSWSDKLLGEVIRLLLEAYYEPQFSGRSHGYRPGRGCHTALSEVVHCWPGTTWFIEADISDCFGSLDHDIMIGILGEKIHDNRFLALLRNMLQAGYLEDWNWNATLSGVPQGGVVSPVLSNIYLNKLDTFVETVLIPQWTRGAQRKEYRPYGRMLQQAGRARRRGDHATARKLYQQLRGMPSRDPRDQGFRRLRYVRYADDVLLGFVGPKAEAEEIKHQLAAFLREDLALNLSKSKTLVTHARTHAARFLGYEITVQHNDTYAPGGRRAANGRIRLRVPTDVIKAKCARYLARGKPEARTKLVNEHDNTIVATYGAEYRGIVQYYLLAGDVWRLNRLHWVMHTSLLKTLAAKHKSTVSKMAAKHQTKIETPHGLRTCIEATFPRSNGKAPLVARFGGIPLKRQDKAVLDDHQPAAITYPYRELIKRLRKGRCELCRNTDAIQVHHVSRLADLNKAGQPQPAWAQAMTKMRRKSLVVCQACHGHIHTRQPTTLTT